MNGGGERGALMAVGVFAHSLKNLKCVCGCVQMREHQTQIVTYCFLLNTWPLIKTTGSILQRPKSTTSCTGVFP